MSHSAFCLGLAERRHTTSSGTCEVVRINPFENEASFGDRSASRGKHADPLDKWTGGYTWAYNSSNTFWLQTRQRKKDVGEAGEVRTREEFRRSVAHARAMPSAVRIVRHGLDFLRR